MQRRNAVGDDLQSGGDKKHKYPGQSAHNSISFRTNHRRKHYFIDHLPRRLLMMLTSSLITLLVASAVAAFPAEAVEARAVCSSGVRIIVARGTFEPPGIGLQQTVVNAILAKIPGSSASAVSYPASPDINNSIAAGVKDTQQQITDYYNACPSGKIVLMGYSQGASVVGNAIAGGGQPVPPSAAPGPAATPISQSIGANGKSTPCPAAARSRCNSTDHYYLLGI